ncbi:PAS domain S-box protein [Maridesulfovibrio sp. FT414]|uniref:PAS domain S-box protein n=1 Tax=Maridesulfovibrio sp. FT414 TaxID=2979469 RepID=UPI003D800681
MKTQSRLTVTAGSLMGCIAPFLQAVTANADEGTFSWPVSAFEITCYMLSALAALLFIFAYVSFRRSAGLRQRLLSTFLLVSLLPMCFLAILDQKVTSDALVDNSRQVMLAAATQTAGVVDSFILTNLSTVRTESSIPQFAEYLRMPPEERVGSPEELAVMGVLSSLKRRDQTYITSIAILDLCGRDVADTYGPDIGSDKADRDYFMEPLQSGLPYVSPVGLSETPSQPSLYFSCPVRDTSGEILGVIRFRFNAAVLQQLLFPRGLSGDHFYSSILFGAEGLRLADTQRPDLVLTPAFGLGEDGGEKLLARRRIRVEGKNTVGTGLERAEFFEPGLTYFYSSLYGPDCAPTLNVKVRMRYAPWTLVLGYSEAANLSKMATQSRYALLVILVIVFGVVVTAFLVSRSITDPLLSLTEAARRLSKGEEEVSVQIHTGDEIDELAETFNRMSSALNSSRRTVLAASERLQTLLDTLPDSVFIHDVNGRILDVNKAFEKTYGYSSAEALSLSIKDLSGEGFTQVEAEKLVGRCVNSEMQAFDWIARRRDGREFPVHVKLRSFSLPEGIHVLALVSDITERKQFEHDLLQARNYIGSIIDSMPSVLVSVDKEGVVTQWNSQAEKVTGIPKSEARGRLFEQVLPYLADEMHKIRAAVKNGTPLEDLRRVHNIDDMTRYEDVIIFPLYAEGIEGAVIRIDDITERVQMEQVMVQSEKMLSVGGLAAGMAHEINNPLAAIMGGVQNMRKRLLGDLQKNKDVAQACDFCLDNLKSYLEQREITRMLDGIQESGARAARIVSNILNFSRRGGEGFFRYDMAELMDKSLELIASDYDLRKDYDFKNIVIKKEYKPDLHPVYCEGNQVQQVFLNLFKNAAEALSEKKFIDEKPQITVRIAEEEGMAVIEIEDNGPGMPDEIVRRAFEPFFTTKPPGKGTGLGLSVSYFIITDQHGGTMEVFSEIGNWTRFVVRLPIGE